METENNINIMTDEEMIIALRDGENKYIDVIMEKYKNLVRNIAGDMFILGAEHDDLIQEGMVGLFKAVQGFDFGRDASFATFANLCIKRSMYKAIEASQNKKHLPLNSYTRLYTNDSEDEFVEGVTVPKSTNPEEVLIDKENLESLQKSIEKELSSFERQVLNLHIIGMGYVEIAGILGKDAKSTENALQRAKGKVKKIIG